MSDDVRQYSGSFAIESLGGFSPVPGPLDVFIEGQNTGPGNTPMRTNGVTRISQVTAVPNVLQTFTLLGWSMRVYLVVSGSVVPYYANMGRLWGGMLIDSPLQSGGGWSMASGSLLAVPGQAVLPPDLSTFDELWTQDDDITSTGWSFTSGPLPPPSNPAFGGVVPTLVGKTFMFNSPIVIRPSTDLKMALVMTPSIMSWQLWLVCLQADFTVLYTVDQKDFSGVHR